MRFRRRAAPPASRGMRSTSSSRSRRHGRRCSSMSSRSPSRRSSSPHYLSIFWEPLNSNPVGHRGRRVVIVVLVALNIVGVRGRAAIDHARGDRPRDQVLLVLSVSSSSSTRRPWSRTFTGASRRPGRASRSRSRSQCSLTRASRRSRTSPRRSATRSRSVPNAYKLVALAVFAIFFTLPFVALSALPVDRIDGELTTLLALPPEEGGTPTTPCSASSRTSASRGAARRGPALRWRACRDDPFHRDERRRHRSVSCHVLDVELQAAAEGLPAPASALQDALARSRGLRRRCADRILLPGDVNFVGTLYSFGATFSFTVAHASIVRLRMLPRRRRRGSDRARPNLRLGNVDWPIFAVVGGLATAISFVVILVEERRRAGRGSRGSGPASSDMSSTVASSATGPGDRPAAARLRPRPRPGVPAPARPDRPWSGDRRRLRRRREPRRRARRADRGRARARGAARPAAERGAAGPRRAGRSKLDEARRIGSRTASPSSRGSSARAAPARRSSRRPAAAARRSSSSARAARTPAAAVPSSARRWTTSSSRRRAG